MLKRPNRVKTVHFNTIHYGEHIHHFFYIFGYLLFFFKYMKNKIGILENDIFPIVNSVILLVYQQKLKVGNFRFEFLMNFVIVEFF